MMQMRARGIKASIAWCVALILGFASVRPAFAIPDICLYPPGPFVVASPTAAGPDDVIVARAGPLWSWGFPNFGGVPLAKVTYGTMNVIDLDVVIGEAVDFPGYRPLSWTYLHDESFAELGPLARGVYLVRSQVRAYDRANGSFVPWCRVLQHSLTVGAEPVTPPRAPVVEFYNAARDHYFVTQDSDEAAKLDAGVHTGWMRTGHSFQAYRPNGSGGRGRSVCRWYGSPDAGLDTHVFSASYAECAAMILYHSRSEWTIETDKAFEIALPDLPTGTCAAGTIPVYRLWNNRTDSDHRYTADPAIKQQMVARGYVPEGFGPDGVAMCAGAP